eukprot:766680-Hanusia_phi.AAC.2
MEATYNVPFLNATNDAVSGCRMSGDELVLFFYSAQAMVHAPSLLREADGLDGRQAARVYIGTKRTQLGSVDTQFLRMQIFPPPLPAGSLLGSSVVGSSEDTVAAVGAPAASVDRWNERGEVGGRREAGRFGSGSVFVFYQTRWNEVLEWELVKGGVLLPPAWDFCSVNETEEGFSDVSCAHEVEFGRAVAMVFLQEGVVRQAEVWLSRVRKASGVLEKSTHHRCRSPWRFSQCVAGEQADGTARLD